MRSITAVLTFASLVLAPRADAQTVSGSQTSPALRAQLVIPQSRAFSWHRGTPAVRITGVTAGVSINEQIASTVVSVHLYNPGGRQAEAEILLPVPDDVIVRGFAFKGAASEPTAKLLPRDEARRTYNAIVSKLRDPALLEFSGYRLVKSSVFPVPARGRQTVRITYEQLLPADGHRIDYVLPRSQSVDNTVQWKVTVQVKSKRSVSTVYSPSHRIETRRRGAGSVVVNIAESAQKEPGAFRLSYLLDDGNVTASLLAYPEPKIKGGYFLLLAGLPSQSPVETKIKREVTIVLDRSGSMAGKKIKQAREAVRQVIAGLNDGETFNIIVYNEAVDVFAEQPVLRNAESEQEAFEFLDSIQPRGGTNIHDALVESLRQKPDSGVLPIVLFLTDGLPTIGKTSEAVIREVATKSNPFKRRVFTFGVGVDVNTPLLEGIADRTRARSTFVLPNEDVELKVSQVFKRLSGPILADTSIRVLDSKGRAAPNRVHDLLPSRLPDLFRDDQLVLLGQYRNEEPIVFELGGNYLGETKAFQFEFQLDKSTVRNAFVPRLWASRRIGVLIDGIRQLGAGTNPYGGNAAVVNNPKTKELIDEIVRLSTEFGILTEYTAFLAREGTDLSDPMTLNFHAGGYLRERAIGSRAGLGSVNQDLNLAQQKAQLWSNPSNKYLDGKLKMVEITSVQQVNKGCYFKRGNNWICNDLAKRKQSEIKPDQEIDFGSPEFFRLVAELGKHNRQGELALYGNILLTMDGKTIRVKNPARGASQ